MTNYKFNIGDKAKKVGGSYQAQGTVVSVFRTRHNENRVVFDFDEPPGLLHIFSEKQLEHVNNGYD